MVKGQEFFVGIILVNFNGAADTIECIESISEMNYNNYKVFVVDNNSSDDSVKRLSDAKKSLLFEFITLKENNGFSAGNNVGICAALEAGVDYVLLLNNDTIVTKDFLSNLMKKAPAESVVTGVIYYAGNHQKLWYAGGSFDIKTAKVSQMGLGMEQCVLPREPFEVTFISGCCMCIPVSVIKEVGFLDEMYFLYEEDADYCYRIVKKSKRIYCIPEAVLYHKVSSSTTKTEKMSPITQYYMVRNKFLFVSKYYRGISKGIPYIHSFFMYVYYCLKYGMKFKYLRWGIIDFLYGKKGKTDRKL